MQGTKGPVMFCRNVVVLVYFATLQFAAVKRWSRSSDRFLPCLQQCTHPPQKPGCRAAHATERSKHKRKRQQHMLHHSDIDAPHPACEQPVQQGQRRYEGLMPKSAASVPSYEQLQPVPPSLMSSDAAITDGLLHFRSLSSNSSTSMSSSSGLSVSKNNQAAAKSAAALLHH